jgi:hypothetical protein
VAGSAATHTPGAILVGGIPVAAPIPNGENLTNVPIAGRLSPRLQPNNNNELSLPVECAMAEPLLPAQNTLTMAILVPQNHPLDERLLVRTPSGQQFEVQIPEGTEHGATLHVNYNE